MDARDGERIAGAIAAADRAFAHARDPRIAPDWTADPLAVDAIAKCVEEVAEQLVGTERQPGVSKMLRAAHPEVPWTTLQRYRAFIVHSYTSVDPQRLRATLEDEIAPLVAILHRMLDA